MWRRSNSSQNSTTRPASMAAPDITNTVSQARKDANQTEPPNGPYRRDEMPPITNHEPLQLSTVRGGSSLPQS